MNAGVIGVRSWVAAGRFLTLTTGVHAQPGLDVRINFGEPLPRLDFESNQYLKQTKTFLDTFTYSERSQILNRRVYKAISGILLRGYNLLPIRWSDPVLSLGMPESSRPSGMDLLLRTKNRRICASLTP